MQLTLMRHFVENVNEYVKNQMQTARSKKSNDVCAWFYRVELTIHRTEPVDGFMHQDEVQDFAVNCTDRIVTDIAIHHLQERFQIAYLPNTVRTLRIIRSVQREALCTRSLPASSLLIELSYNAYYGSLDMSGLPSDLQVFRVQNNNLMGPIHFLQLTASLRSIDLSHNPLNTETLYYSDPPQDLVALLVCSGVKSVCPVDEMRTDIAFTGVGTKYERF